MHANTKKGEIIQTLDKFCGGMNWRRHVILDGAVKEVGVLKPRKKVFQSLFWGARSPNFESEVLALSSFIWTRGLVLLAVNTV